MPTQASPSPLNWIPIYNAAIQGDSRSTDVSSTIEDLLVPEMKVLPPSWVPGYLPQSLADLPAQIPSQFTKGADYDELMSKLDDFGGVGKGTWYAPAVETAGLFVRGGIEIALSFALDDRRLPIPDGPRVLRRGRVDLGPIELVISRVLGATDYEGKDIQKYVDWINGLPNLQRLLLDDPSPGTLESLAGLLTAIVGDIESWRGVQDVFGISSDTMTKEQSERWFELYMKGDVGSSGDRAPPADIFETAGEHFAVFVDGLDRYASKLVGTLPMQFHQLGDMIDLWMGFACHYKPAAGKTPFGFETDDGYDAVYQAVDARQGAEDPPAEERGTEMGYWVKNCLSTTYQGRWFAAARETLESIAKRNDWPAPVLLSGNHDNYFANGQFSVTYDLVDPSTPVSSQASANSSAKGTATIGPLPNSFFADGLYMEHGHQWDKMNADNAPLLPFTRILVGLNAPMGELLTQPPFIRPAPLRQAEDRLLSAFNQLTSDGPPAPGTSYSARLTAMAYAVDKMATLDAYVYLMGHTHTPCLARVRFSTQETADARIDAARQQIVQAPPKIRAQFAGALGLVDLYPPGPAPNPCELGRDGRRGPSRLGLAGRSGMGSWLPA